MKRADITVGKCYYRKTSGKASVRKVLVITESRVEYLRLHGPALKKGKYGKVSLESFSQWASKEVEELADYSHLDGAIIRPTFVVLNTKNQPIVRCGWKRAQFYLRKGYVEVVSDGVLRYTNDAVEKRLHEIHGSELNDFFMEIKNDLCAVCGVRVSLTRHHIIPQRHIEKVPYPWRACLCNVLFLCIRCHETYEQHLLHWIEPVIGNDPIQYIHWWRDHFVETMKPQHLPSGWDILTAHRFLKEFANESI